MCEGSESFYHAVVGGYIYRAPRLPAAGVLIRTNIPQHCRSLLALLMHLFVFFYLGMEIPTGDAGAIPGEHSDLLVARIAQRLSIAALEGIGENIARLHYRRRWKPGWLYLSSPSESRP